MSQLNIKPSSTAKLISQNRFDEILSKFKKLKPIAVLGDIGVDKYTSGSVDRISPEAPVPVLRVRKQWYQLGLAANLSNNLNDLQIASSLYSVCGKDTGAEVLFDILKSKNLDSSGIIQDTDRPTTLKERITTSTQQICRVDFESTEPIPSSYVKKLLSVFKKASSQHSALILEDYSKGLLNKSLVVDLIDYCQKNKIMVCVDPGKSTDPEIYSGVDLLKPNLLEARLIVEHFGEFSLKSNLIKMGQFILTKLNLKYLVITLGSEGMAIFTRDLDAQIIPTVAPEVYDVSGAGDTAISVLTSSLLAGANLVEAAWIANCASGVVVGKMGTATVNQDELKSFYSRLKNEY